MGAGVWAAYGVTFGTVGLTLGIGATVSGFQSKNKGKGFWQGFTSFINNNWACNVAISSALYIVALGIGVARYAIAKAKVANAVKLAKKAQEISVRDKLEKYLLNPNHPVGGSKAKWFKQALGYDLSNMDDLAKQIVFNPETATPTVLSQYGQKYSQIITIVGANGRIIETQFVWIQNLDDVTRLITAIPT